MATELVEKNSFARLLQAPSLPYALCIPVTIVSPSEQV